LFSDGYIIYNDWANQWLVDFNSQKTKALIISNTGYIDPVIKFNDEQVEIVECHKHLDVTFSSDGKPTEDIASLTITNCFDGYIIYRPI
jgi:hypothetical protein